MINGLICTKIVDNLNTKILSGKIQKIYQIDNSTLLFKIRANHKNYQLINNIDNNNLTLHITKQVYATQEIASNFTMILRKQLEGAIIKKIWQVECDRVIVFEVEKQTELRDNQKRYIVFELFGRQANTIICDNQFIILELLKKVYFYNNSTRTLAKNLKYEYLKSEKINTLNDFYYNDNIYNKFQGFSKALANQFQFDSHKYDAKDILTNFLNSNEIYLYDNEISYIPLTTLEENPIIFNDLDEAFDYHFLSKQRINTKSTLFKKEIKTIKGIIKRNEKKIIKLKKQYNDNLDYQINQKLGTLLYNNLYLFDKNKRYDHVEVFDYDLNQQTIINLDKRYSISDNAKNYLNKYRKMKNSFVYIEQEIIKAQNSNHYLNNILEFFGFANNNDLLEIIDELERKKYLKSNFNTKKQNKKKQPKYETYYSSSGYKILVGKNSIQNDYVTFKLADKDDLWFHIHNQTGAHVVLKSDNPSNQDIIEAASLAIFFSNCDIHGNYDVVYTKIKNLKKTKSLGEVSFKTHQLLKVNYDINITSKLRRV